MTHKTNLFTAASILIGTVVGAGFLGIPYVISKSGFLIGVFYLIFLGLIIMFLNLALGEISLRTKGDHQLTGYASIYLGKIGRRFMLFSQLFGIYFALLAYIIGISASVNFIFNYGNLNFVPLIGIVVWLIFSFLVSLKINSIIKWIGVGALTALVLILAIAFIHFPNVDYSNLQTIDLKNIFIPFGVILFSYLGFSATPEIERYLHGKEKLMKKTLIIGTLVPIVVYLLFAGIVVGVYGKNIPELSTFAFGKLVIILGIVTMSTAYLSLSNALRDLYNFDYHISRRKSWFIVSIVPIFLFAFSNLLKFSFTNVIAIGGTISGGITALLILLMVKKAKKKGNRKPEYSLKFNKFILFFIGLIFALGIIYGILSIFGIM